MLELRVPAVPVAQPRVRAAARFGKATMYTPTKIKAADGSKKDHPIVAFKATVRMAFERKFSGSPFIAPLRVDCCFVMPRPQKLMRKSDPPGRIPHAQKPDRDNLDKAVLDALKGLAWTDDCQASSGLIEKWWTAIDESAHVVVRISVWNQVSGEFE
jgi:Holliday junction resolvase RusA-like endonuclease